MTETLMWDVPLYRLTHCYSRLFHALPVSGSCITKVSYVSEREVVATVRIPCGQEPGFAKIVKPNGPLRYRSPSRFWEGEIEAVYSSPEEELRARGV